MPINTKIIAPTIDMVKYCLFKYAEAPSCIAEAISCILEFPALELKIFFPVNRGNTHWTMAAIYIEKREIIYYDSMGSAGRDITESLLRYLDDESKDKRGYPLEDKNSWSLKKGKSPIQTNGYDCGVFATMNIDFLSDDLPLQYNQGDIAFFRNKIAANIVRGTMDYDV